DRPVVTRVASAFCPPEIRAVLESCGISVSSVLLRSLPLHTEPPELVLVEIGENGREHRLVVNAARAWREMCDAAAAADVKIRIVSAFRSVERQAEIIRAKLAKGLSIEEIL